MLSLSLTLFDIFFWLCVAMVATLAFAIEAGVGGRTRKLVLSSILSTIVTALLMLLLVEDNTKFYAPAPGAAKKQEPEKVYAKEDDPNAPSIEERYQVVQEPSRVGAHSDDKRTPEVDHLGFRDCPTCPAMVVVDRGIVTLGSDLTEAGRGIGEAPRVKVEIARPIGVGRLEVLRGEYAAFVKATNYRSTTVCTGGEEMAKGQTPTWQSPGFDQTDDHPVVCVSHTDASAYVAWLSKTTGRRYQLPSQAEWEHFARAGTETPFSTGYDLTIDQANFNRRSVGTTPGGVFKANPWNLSDVHGNVWELTDDCWLPDLELVPTDARPVGNVGDCSRRVVKGGGWNSTIDKLRAAGRTVLPVDVSTNATGFRVVRVM